MWVYVDGVVFRSFCRLEFPGGQISNGLSHPRILIYSVWAGLRSPYSGKTHHTCMSVRAFLVFWPLSKSFVTTPFFIGLFVYMRLVLSHSNKHQWLVEPQCPPSLSFALRMHSYSILLPSGWVERNGPKGSGTIRRCGLVEVGVVLSEEVCHCGGRHWGLLCPRYCPVSQITSCCLQDVGLSTTSPVPYLLVCCPSCLSMKIMD